MIERKKDGGFTKATLDSAAKSVVNLVAFHGFARGVPKTDIIRVVRLLRGMKRWRDESLDDMKELVMALDGVEASFYVIRVAHPKIWLE